MTLGVRLRLFLLRAIAALEEWAWRGAVIPPIPPAFTLDSPTRKLTHLCTQHGGFHSVRELPDGRWRVRLHQPDGTVHAATGTSIDDAITALATQLGVRG